MYQNVNVQQEGYLAYQYLRDIASSTLWVKYKSDPCDMYKMEVGERVANRGQCIFPHPLQQVFTFISSDERVEELDQSLQQSKDLEVVSNDLKVYYERYKGSWPVAGRDFVTVGMVHREEGRIFWAYKSIGYPYPEVKNVVRGEVKIGGFILEGVEGDKTKVTYISDVDLKGDIPGFMKKQVDEEEGALVGHLKELMKEYYQH